jgi:hypothetical protein
MLQLVPLEGRCEIEALPFPLVLCSSCTTHSEKPATRTTRVGNKLLCFQFFKLSRQCYRKKASLLQRMEPNKKMLWILGNAMFDMEMVMELKARISKPAVAAGFTAATCEESG